jgi:hypothetical protein
MFFVSCNNGDYLQEFRNFNEFNKIENMGLIGWFPFELIKSKAPNLKIISYLGSKCIFGIFNYKKEELYDSIFNKENRIDKTYIEIFQSQIELVENIIPEWFSKVNYWKTKNSEIILFIKCYAYNDLKQKQIYYFHPKEKNIKSN